MSRMGLTEIRRGETVRRLNKMKQGGEEKRKEGEENGGSAGGRSSLGFASAASKALALPLPLPLALPLPLPLAPPYRATATPHGIPPTAIRLSTLPVLIFTIEKSFEVPFA